MTDTLAQVLAAGDPRIWRTLLADHRPDAANRCLRCPVGNSAGRQVWPCRLHDLARTAQALAEQRSTP